jgi:hypothetical protein
VREINLIMDQGLLEPILVPMLSQFMERWNVSAFEAILLTRILSESQLRNSLAHAHKLPVIDQIPTDSTLISGGARLTYQESKREMILGLKSDRLAEGRAVHIVANPNTALEYLKHKDHNSYDIFVATRSIVFSAIDNLFPINEQLGLV